MTAKTSPLFIILLLPTDVKLKTNTKRKTDKHCSRPEEKVVEHGNISSIVPSPLATDLYPYGTEVNYTCNLGYELPGGSRVQTTHCLQTNTWSDISSNCSIISCPTFTVANGDVNFTSLEYGGTARVSCHRGYWTDNNFDEITVHCLYNKQWSVVPTCTVDNLRRKQRLFSVHHDKIRDTSAMFGEVRVRSRLDCASRCAEDYYCRGANFNSDENKEGGMCRLFLHEAHSGDFTGDTEWNYFEVDSS